jgi:predicted DNA-binding antitoxin AbrB/MazE fold protein
MSNIVLATFDGEVLRPDKPISLPPNSRVRLTLETEPTEDEISFLDVAQNLQLDGPVDWSNRLSGSQAPAWEPLSYKLQLARYS